MRTNESAFCVALTRWVKSTKNACSNYCLEILPNKIHNDCVKFTLFIRS